MSTVIDVKEFIPDKHSEFNIRKFKIHNLKFERPVKVIDAKTTTMHVFQNYKRDFDVELFESSIYVYPSTVNKILKERNEEVVRNHFNFRRWMKEYSFVIATTLQFNPVKNYDLKKVQRYLRYVYEYSKPFVFVPNIKIEKYEKIGKKTVKVSITSLDEYIWFVDEIVEFLDKRNDKHIFVPVSLRFGINELVRLIKHYLKKEYRCLWFDFEGAPVSEARIARIRVIFDEIEERNELENIVVYVTNVRREIISNFRDPKSPASDVLASLIGANIIGTNREPPKPQDLKTKIDRKELLRHKARLLDPQSYYYFKVIDYVVDEQQKLNFLKKDINTIENAKRLDKEFKSQTEFFLENNSIKEYVSGKSMLKEHKNGELLTALFPPDVSLSEWY